MVPGGAREKRLVIGPGHADRRLVLARLGTIIASAGLAAPPPNRAKAGQPLITHHRTIQIDGLSIFYRESDPANAPVILLLHGYPSASFMFRDLIPLLAVRYHVMAPDYPGFGYSDAPPPPAASPTRSTGSRTSSKASHGRSA